MLNKVVCIDIETYDPYIKRKLGAGWVFKYHDYPNCDYELIGVAIDDRYYTNIEHACKLVQRYVDDGYTIVCHNASYDMGGLHAYGVDFKNCPVLDTRIAAILFDNTIKEGYSLDALARKYLCSQKEDDKMVESAWYKGIYPLLKKEQKERANSNGTWNRPGLDKKRVQVKKWVKENMHLVQEVDPDVVAHYATIDTELTMGLLEK